MDLLNLKLTKAAVAYRQGVCPSDRAVPRDYEERLVRLAVAGYPQLAADSILHKDLVGKLSAVLEGAISKLNIVFKTGDSKTRKRVYETIIEIAFNIVGMEGKAAGFSLNERDSAFGSALSTLARWERIERVLEKSQTPVADIVVSEFLLGMKQVLYGKSMAAKIAEIIEDGLVSYNILSSFVLGVREQIRKNVYYRICDQGMSKLGNDSATGLRFVRHLGFVQVSSNPVIAARAYEEFPELWECFREIVRVNPRWRRNPEKYSDEMTMHSTLVSILPNILIFRPIALLSDFRNGLVSYQLNPLGAENLKASMKDAEYICSVLRKILTRYDEWLGWDSNLVRGRPNIVFKVAASNPVALRITSEFNARGIGTNNTVTYGVSQELTLLIAVVDGMVQAVKRKIPLTQAYETNMIGRLEDHLRESEIERLMKVLSPDAVNDVARALGLTPDDDPEKTIRMISSKKVVPALSEKKFSEVLSCHYGPYQEDIPALLEIREQAIRYSGIFVTRRVWQLFFSPEARGRWSRYYQTTFNLSSEEIDEIMSRIDLLPASKRRAEDTYLVLGTPNVTNTDFPDQQARVFLRSLEDGFDLSNHQGSIAEDPEPMLLDRLLETEDFRRVYELTFFLASFVKGIGINDILPETRGMESNDWSSFGAVRKTMDEFRAAYLAFREKVIDFVHTQCMNV